MADREEITTEAGIIVPDSYVDQQERELTKDALAEAAVMQEILVEGEELYKAVREQKSQFITRRIIPSLIGMGYYQGIKDPAKATTATFAIEKQIGATPCMRFLIESFVGHIMRFGTPSTNPTQRGYRIVMRDPYSRPTSKDKERIQELTDFVYNGGFRSRRPADRRWGVWSGDYLDEAWTFPKTLAALTRDSMTLDAAALWMNPGQDKVNTPVAMFKPVDAALIRKTQPEVPDKMLVLSSVDGMYEPYKAQLREDIKMIEYVMLRPDSSAHNGETVMAEYGADEMCYIQRNPRTDWWANDYGFSELESMIEIVIGQTNALSYNTSYFTHNSVPPGILVGSGNVSRKWIRDFVSTLVSQVGTPNKWHKIPMLFGGENFNLAFTPLRDRSKEDMQWRDWIIFLINLACATYRVASEEVGFQAVLTRGGEQSATGGQQRVDSARESGFLSVADTMEAELDRSLIMPFYADEKTGVGPYKLEFVGKSPENEELKHRFSNEMISTGRRTLNDQRKLDDMAPYRDPITMELWNRIKNTVLDEHPEYKHDDVALDEVCDRLYRQYGGEYRPWTDMPLNQAAISLRYQMTQEEAMAQQDAMGGDDMGGFEGPGPGSAPIGGQQSADQLQGLEGVPQDGRQEIADKLKDVRNYVSTGKTGKEGEDPYGEHRLEKSATATLPGYDPILTFPRRRTYNDEQAEKVRRNRSLQRKVDNLAAKLKRAPAGRGKGKPIREDELLEVYIETRERER